MLRGLRFSTNLTNPEEDIPGPIKLVIPETLRYWAYMHKRHFRDVPIDRVMACDVDMFNYGTVHVGIYRSSHVRILVLKSS
jgi:hypothetical protein